MPYEQGFGTGYVLSRPKIAGHHVWRNTAIIGPVTDLFFSDEIMARMKKEKIKYIDARRMEESDREWIAEENIPEWLEWAKENPELAAGFRI
jgi:hypothetical protein